MRLCGGADKGSVHAHGGAYHLEQLSRRPHTSFIKRSTWIMGAVAELRGWLMIPSWTLRVRDPCSHWIPEGRQLLGNIEYAEVLNGVDWTLVASVNFLPHTQKFSLRTVSAPNTDCLEACRQESETLWSKASQNLAVPEMAYCLSSYCLWLREDLIQKKGIYMRNFFVVGLHS